MNLTRSTIAGISLSLLMGTATDANGNSRIEIKALEFHKTFLEQNSDHWTSKGN